MFFASNFLFSSLEVLLRQTLLKSNQQSTPLSISLFSSQYTKYTHCIQYTKM